MGIGSLGFLSGASGTMLKSIEAREEAERKIKLEKDLIKLRADTEEVFERKKVSGAPQYDPTTKMKTYYNSYREPIKEESATQAEIDAYDADVKKRTLEGLQAQQTYDFGQRDQKMQEEAHQWNIKATQASIGASNRSNRSLEGSGSGKKANLSEVMDAIMTRNAKAIQELSGQEGVPLSEIQAGAWRFAENMIAKGASPLDLERNFSNYLTNLRKAAQKQGSRLDRYKRKVVDSDTTGW